MSRFLSAVFEQPNGQNTVRTIPIIDQRDFISSLPGSDATAGRAGQLSDSFDRPLLELQISVTDRINLISVGGVVKSALGTDCCHQPRAALLSFEEITHLARQFVAQGVKKIRLTGGEPLLRKQLETLVAQLAALLTPQGTPVEIALTTNGLLLSRQAQTLKDAGLQRVTVTLDGLDDGVIQRMNVADIHVSEVLAGLEAARHAGFANLKVNMVVKRGTNELEILPMARYFQGTGITLLFIESTNLDASNGWRTDEVLSSADVLGRIHQAMPLVALTPESAGATAEMWGYVGVDGQHDPQLGAIGVVSGVSNPFCGVCNQAQLSTEGRLLLCRFASDGHDLRSLIRRPGGVTDLQLQNQIANIWCSRADCSSEQRTNALLSARVNAAWVRESSDIEG